MLAFKIASNISVLEGLITLNQGNYIAVRYCDYYTYSKKGRAAFPKYAKLAEITR